MSILKKLTLCTVLTFGVIAQSVTFLASPALAASCIVGPRADLKGCDLRAENLHDADLTGADLTGANLLSAVLDNADLTGATLTGVKSGNITGTPKGLPAKWNLLGGYLLGPGAWLQQANLKTLVLAGFDLTGADLSYANVSGADLSGTNLTNATLTGIFSGNIIGFPTLPSGWQATDVGGYLIGQSASLVGADFRNADLSGFDLSGHDLTGANFGGSNLNGTNLTATNLTGVVSGNIIGSPLLSSGTVLAGGYLVGPNVNLVNADLSGKNLTGANLYGANLDFTNLKSANLTGVASGRTTGTPQLSAGWESLNGYLVGPAANLDGADLSGVSFKDIDLSSVDLSGANLDSVSSGGVVGNPVLPTGWLAVNGYLVGPKADLSSANLATADLANADLSNANLNGADLTGAKLSKVILTGVKSGGLIGNPTLSAKWHIFNGYLVGPGANLSQSDLSSQNFGSLDLSGADLTGSNLASTTFVAANLSSAKLANTDLTDADLTDAVLTGVSSGNITGVPQTTAPWQIGNAYLIGPGASLEGADLSNLSLTYTDLSGASFYGANLAGTDLLWSTLNNCELRGANLTDATLSHASLVGTTSGDIIGYPKLSADQTLVNGYLLAAGANASSADLSYQDLSALNLSGVSFVGANLTSSNFNSSNLMGADLTDATLDSTVFATTNLSNVVSSGIIGTPKSLPIGWFLVDGSILRAFATAPAPTFTGGNTVGSTLTATVGSWGNDAVVDILWLRDDLVISDVASYTYTLTSADVGHTISVAATGTAAGYVTKTVNSTKSIQVLAQALAAMKKAAAPKISGKAKVGVTVKAVSSAWVAGAKISYQWLLDGKAIKAATKASYKLAKTAKGHKLSVRVTQTANGYVKTIKTSAALKVG